tara:strand:- start:57 stop:641 length:585 start_codon:yes stop_codon:yes gene_type:complete
LVILPKIGVLAIQGDFREHGLMLDSIGQSWDEIRLPNQLSDLDGLIIPGGESTTIVQLIDTYNLRIPIQRLASNGLAIWGTCAGMIVVAKTLSDKKPVPLGLMDIAVSRNAFGRQIDSFETTVSVTGIKGEPIHAVFIRAPQILNTGPNVDILSTLENGTPVTVRENKILATSFHPELTEDTRMHELFISIAGS